MAGDGGDGLFRHIHMMGGRGRGRGRVGAAYPGSVVYGSPPEAGGKRAAFTTAHRYLGV